MNKKSLLTIIGVLLVTNIFTFTYFSLQKPKTLIKEYMYLKLSGETEHWKIENINLSVDPTTFGFDNGVLTYKGKDLKDLSQEVTIDTYFYDSHDHYFSSDSGELSYTRSKRLGGGSFDVREYKPPTLQDLKKWYVVIRWDGKEERMKLKTDLKN